MATEVTEVVKSCLDAGYMPDDLTGLDQVAHLITTYYKVKITFLLVKLYENRQKSTGKLR